MRLLDCRRLPRRRQVDALLEERALERVRLVEDREQLERAARQRRLRPRTPRPSMNDSTSAASCAASRSARMSGDSMSVRSRSKAAPNSRASLTRMTPRLPESASGLSTAGYVVAAASGARIVEQRDSLELRRRQTGALERLACLQLVPAAVGGRRWIPGQAKRGVEVRGQQRGPVADGKDRVGTLRRAGRDRQRPRPERSSRNRTGIA